MLTMNKVDAQMRMQLLTFIAKFRLRNHVSKTFW